jgi:hypothetical protein
MRRQHLARYCVNVLRNFTDRALARAWYRQFRDVGHARLRRALLSLSPEERAARGIKRVVRLASTVPGMWARTIALTPGATCQWGKTLFVAEGDGDMYLVINSVIHPANSRSFPKVNFPERSRVWGLHMEPEEYIIQLGYDDAVEHQRMSRFYTSAPSLLAQEGIYTPSPPYVHFLLGKTWDFLAAQGPLGRHAHRLGFIMSNLQDLTGHRTRLAFLEALDASTIPYVFWGRGKGLERYRGYRGFVFSKWKAHASCRYTIVLENSVAPYYWSEKVADAMLAWSLPIYHGCPNLSEYLPDDSFLRIDIRDPATAIETIQSVLEKDPYEARLKALAEARHRLLNQHHLYAFIDRELDAYLG